MAREVLEHTGAWLEEHILEPLRAEGAPAARIDAMVKRLDELYSGGRQACLLNMLSAARIREGPFTPMIQHAFEALIGALCAVVMDAGFGKKAARSRAERAVMMLQGSLVLSRGLGTPRPFREFLKSLPGDLLEA